MQAGAAQIRDDSNDAAVRGSVRSRPRLAFQTVVGPGHHAALALGDLNSDENTEGKSPTNKSRNVALYEKMKRASSRNESQSLEGDHDGRQAA